MHKHIHRCAIATLACIITHSHEVGTALLYILSHIAGSPARPRDHGIASDLDVHHVVSAPPRPARGGEGFTGGRAAQARAGVGCWGYGECRGGHARSAGLRV